MSNHIFNNQLTDQDIEKLTNMYIKINSINSSKCIVPAICNNETTDVAYWQLANCSFPIYTLNSSDNEYVVTSPIFKPNLSQCELALTNGLRNSSSSGSSASDRWFLMQSSLRGNTDIGANNKNTPQYVYCDITMEILRDNVIQWMHKINSQQVFYQGYYSGSSLSNLDVPRINFQFTPCHKYQVRYKFSNVTTRNYTLTSQDSLYLSYWALLGYEASSENFDMMYDEGVSIITL